MWQGRIYNSSMEKHPDFELYVGEIEGKECYYAGFPGYPRNFSRDGIDSGIIAADHHLLNNQLKICAEHQGTKFDRLTGEEPGKIHHEYPGVTVHNYPDAPENDPYKTTYNACDTTSLYLIGLEFLRHLNQQEADEFLFTHRESIEAAIGYLERHTDEDDIFWEFPPEGAEHFSLKITYWKDSIIPSKTGKEEPAYPVAFALAQFQAARGFLAAGRLLDREDLEDKAHNMFRAGIDKFISEDFFCVYEDQEERREQPSSDELHSLAYIPPEYQEEMPIQAIYDRAWKLMTPVGIACTPKEISDEMSDTYHGYVVWIFEQALIHYGCRKFGLKEMMQATKRCVDLINTGQELLSVDPEIEPRGNKHQLWSIAAKIYFTDQHSLRQVDWL